MQRYKLIISYDGTDFSGWQIQPEKLSIEGVMRDAFVRAFDNELTLIGASRTDAGVHAFGQVLLCITPLMINAQKLLWIWNRALPSSILIRSCELIGEDFHPQANVAEKTYWYTLFLKRPLPYSARYGWYCPQKLDRDILLQALKIFVGKHDFKAFCKTEDAPDDTVRTIYSLDVCDVKVQGFSDCDEDMVRIVVRGDRFMRHMIRRIVGAAVSVATSPFRSIAELQKVLDMRNPNHTFPKAPPQGLMLRIINYKR